WHVIFFFQAEDGIRDFHVTGVQTCALPILEAGEEELARKALSEMKHWEARADQYRTCADKTAGQVRELKEQLSRLEKKYQELRDKKDALIARANAAKTKQRIHTTLHKIDSESAIRGFERME